MVNWNFSNRDGLNTPGADKAVLAALQLSQAIIQFKPDGTILHANPNFLKTMGYELHEIQGKHHGMFAPRGVRDSAEYKSFWETLGNGRYQKGLYRRIAKGGRDVWLQASYNPILDRRGKVERVVKCATNVTEETLLNTELQG